MSAGNIDCTASTASKAPANKKSMHGPMDRHLTEERVDPSRDPLLHEKLAAEFVGTFMLVFTVGVAATSDNPSPPVAIGLMLAVQIYAFGSVSGGMFNPAVTLAVLLSRRSKIEPVVAAMYMGVQILAGLLAGLIALGATNKSFCFDYALVNPESGGGNFGSSLILEVIFTMALCNTVLVAGTSNDCPNQYFGFAIGMTVTGGAMACGSFDQGSFNPAVTIGMNIANYVAGDRGTANPSFGAWFLYLVAPMIGACIAAGTFFLTRRVEFEEAQAVPNSE